MTPERARPAMDSRPLRLGYVVKRFPRLSQTFFLNEIIALRRQGHDVQVFSLTDPEPADRALVPEACGIPVVSLDQTGDAALFRALLYALRQHPLRLLRTLALMPLWAWRDKGLWTSLREALVLAPAADRLRLDHLHAHLRFAGDCLWLVGTLTGRRWSFTAHAKDIHVGNQFLTEKLVAAAHVVTVCDYNKAVLARRLVSSRHGKVHVIRPFLAAELLAQTPAAPSDPGHDALRIACVARCVPKKGLHILIRAIACLRDRGLAVRATLIGDGPQRRPLQDLVADLALDAMVALPGAATAARVRELLAQSHCLVLAAMRAPDGDIDATPTVLGEAMALGLPVVSTRLAGIPEIVPEGAGLLVAPGDPDALADALAEIAALPAGQRRAMGERGRRFVQAHWNGDQDVHRLIALFREAGLHAAQGSSAVLDRRHRIGSNLAGHHPSETNR